MARLIIRNRAIDFFIISASRSCLMNAIDFILGYSLPMFGMTIAQAAITFLAASVLGLELNANILIALVITAVISLLFVGTGLFFGSLLNERAVGGICGALLTNVAGWLSGVFIPIDLIGGSFKTITHLLPFYHSVEVIRVTLNGNFSRIFPHLFVVIGYALIILVSAILLFKRKMRG